MIPCSAVHSGVGVGCGIPPQAPPTAAHEPIVPPAQAPPTTIRGANGRERERETDQRERAGDGESIILPLGGKSGRGRACTMPTEGDLPQYQRWVDSKFRRLENRDSFNICKSCFGTGWLVEKGKFFYDISTS